MLFAQERSVDDERRLFTCDPHKCAAKRMGGEASAAAAASFCASSSARRQTHCLVAYRGCPSLSGRKSTPHSMVGYDFPRRIRWRWLTLSSAPQKPSAASFGDDEVVAAAAVVDGIVYLL